MGFSIYSWSEHSNQDNIFGLNFNCGPYFTTGSAAQCTKRMGEDQLLAIEYENCDDALQWESVELENKNLDGFANGCILGLEELPGSSYQVI